MFHSRIYPTPTRQDVLAEAYSSGTLAFPKGHDEILEPVGVHVHEWFVNWLPT